MQNNSARSIFCIFCILPGAICKICRIYHEHILHIKHFFCILKHFLVNILHFLAYYFIFCIFFCIFCDVNPHSAYICKIKWDSTIWLVWVGALMSSQKARQESRAAPEQKLACACIKPQLIVICGPPRWYQRLGHGSGRALLSRPLSAIQAFHPTRRSVGACSRECSAITSFKLRLVVQSSSDSSSFAMSSYNCNLSRKLASGWKMAGTRRGCQCRPGSPDQSEGFPWCLYHSFSTWDTFQNKSMQTCKICKICNISKICKM